MGAIPYSQLQRGTFLIAAPEMDVPLYLRSVILICDHSQAGSFGLMINKPIDIQLPTDLMDIKNTSNPHVQIFAGGALQTQKIMILHTANIPDQDMLQVCEGVYLGGTLSFLQEALTNAVGPRIHFFFGYAGWSSGQLEKEIFSGKWILAPGSAPIVFETQASEIWPTTLRNLGGKYRSLSLIPEDLSLN